MVEPHLALGPLFGTILSMPLIDGGRNQANLERSVAALDESVADYRQRVLAAFAEVEDDLVAIRTLAGQSEAARDAVVSATRAFSIADSRYRAGASSYLDVIDAQRSLLSIQRFDTQVKARALPRPSRSSARSAAAGMRRIRSWWEAVSVMAGARWLARTLRRTTTMKKRKAGHSPDLVGLISGALIGFWIVAIVFAMTL